MTKIISAALVAICLTVATAMPAHAEMTRNILKTMLEAREINPESTAGNAGQIYVTGIMWTVAALCRPFTLPVDGTYRENIDDLLQFLRTTYRDDPAKWKRNYDEPAVWLVLEWLVLEHISRYGPDPANMRCYTLLDNIFPEQK